MRITRLAILVILAAFLAVEPVVHSHPLVPGGGASDLSAPNVCAICAVGTDKVIVAAPVVTAPVAVIGHVATTPLQPTTVETRVPLASRAPPAA
jgi:hypothetical protein